VKDHVIINRDQCSKIGTTLKDIHIKNEYFNREFLRLPVDQEIVLWTYLISVGICHQTYTLHSKKLNLWGWDYLEKVFIDLAKQRSKLLDPEYILSVSRNSLIQELSILFSDDGKPQNCTLDRLEERVDLMMDLANITVKKFYGNLSGSLFREEVKLIDSNQGLYKLLRSFEAYSDPLFKKSTLLIKFLIEAGIIKVLDPENFIPIMDYHMQRVLMRSGCVEVIDKELRHNLVSKIPIDSDQDIREACIAAMHCISEYSKHLITIMNDYFWTLGRSCCNKTLLCRDKNCEKSPCSFFLIADLTDHTKCIFQDVCKASHDDDYKNLWQPVVKTHYY